MMRSCITAMGVLLLNCVAITHDAVADRPWPVDVTCPVCDENFVYISFARFSAVTVQSCPWCLHSAVARDLKSVHPDDVETIRSALASADESLDEWSTKAVGVGLAEYVGDPPYLMLLQQLLAMMCADVRRDLDPDSLDMMWVLMMERGDPASRYVRRRLMHALQREIDGPFDVSRFDDPREGEAYAARMAIERRQHIASLQLESGMTEEAIKTLEHVVKLVDAWVDDFFDDDFRWRNQVRMITEDAQRAMEQAHIRSWSLERLEQVAALYEPDSHYRDDVNLRAGAALQELGRRGDSDSIDALARFGMTSLDHLFAAARGGLIGVGHVRERPELLEYLREVARSIPDIAALNDFSAEQHWRSVHALTREYLSDDLLKRFESESAIRLFLADDSLERALAAPLYSKMVVTEREIKRESPFGFQHDELRDILGAEFDVDQLAIGSTITLPQVPDYFARDRWPAWSMWHDLDEFIEGGSTNAVRTVMRWLPTLGNEQLEFESGIDEYFGRILTVIHNQPETWRIVLDSQLAVTTSLQTTCLLALRACAGDEEASSQLAQRAIDQEEWHTEASIALAALTICEDRSLYPAALERSVRAEWLLQDSIRDYLVAVAGPNDLPRMSVAARMIRALPLPDDSSDRAKQRLFHINRFEDAIREIRLNSLFERATER